ncbi:MAG: DUF3313 domain-containing protein [Methylotetracoccus sp.]
MALCCLISAGCGTTKEARTVTPSGFLGSYSGLHPGGDSLPLLVYGNPTADCRRYDKIMLDPVTLWARGEHSPFAKLSPGDRRILASQAQQRLTDMATRAGYSLVDRPGPGVMRIRIAITEAEKADVALKDASIIAPYVGGAAIAWSEFKGQAAFTGGAAIEAEIVDALTGERLYAMVDKRVGTLDIRNTDKLDDIDSAFDEWRDRGIARLKTCRATGSFVPKAGETNLEQTIESYRP